MDILENNKILNLTRDLIKFKSDQHNQEERDNVLGYIIDYIKKNSYPQLICQIKKNINPRTNQQISSVHIFNPSVTDKKSLLLLGHVDVIMAEDDQYQPRISDNNLYGRGAGDMKSGIAIAIELFKKYHRSKNVQLLITNDEEIGSAAGAEKISPLISPDAVIALEPTNLSIVHKQKGAMWVDIDVEGPGGHASRPSLSDNCIDISLELCKRLRNELITNKEWGCTINIGGLFGGNLILNSKIKLGPANSSAKSAKMRLDVRLTNEYSHDEIISIFQKYAKEIEDKLNNKHKTDTYRIKISRPVVTVDHLYTKEDDPLIQNLAKHFLKTTGEHPTITGSPAASDGRYFSKKGIPTAVFGPISHNHHSLNEHVEIESIKKVHDVLDSLLEEW